MSIPISNMSTTWSDGALHTAIKMAVTDTSSNAASLLVDLTVGGTPMMRLDKTGRMLLGLSDPVAVAGQYGPLTTSNVGSAWGMVLFGYGTDVGFPGIGFARTNGANAATHGIVAANNRLFEIEAWGSDGSAYVEAVDIIAYVDGAGWGAGSSPGYMNVRTTPPGSNTPLERTRWSSNGSLLINMASTDSVTLDGAVGKLQMQGSGASNWGTASFSTGANTGGIGYGAAKTRGGDPATHTILVDGDNVFEATGYGSDGSTYRPLAGINYKVDGTPGASAMPGRIMFSTNAGGTTLTENMRLSSTGFLNLLSGSFGRGGVVVKTANFTVANNESVLSNNKSGSTCTVTMPSASAFVGREIIISNQQAQLVVSASSNVIDQAGGGPTTSILAATTGKWALLVSNGANWVIMMSN